MCGNEAPSALGSLAEVTQNARHWYRIMWGVHWSRVYITRYKIPARPHLIVVSSASLPKAKHVFPRGAGAWHEELPALKAGRWIGPARIFFSRYIFLGCTDFQDVLEI